MAEPRNRIHLTAEVAAPPDRVFDYFTHDFDEIWQAGGGTHVDYAVRYDYRPTWQGPIVAAAMRLGWALRGRRRLAKRFRG